MVKFGKNKMKVLNKLAKKQKSVTTPASSTSNKILKKKINTEKKVSFQKEVLLKDAVSGGSSLVKNVSREEILLKELFDKEPKQKKKIKIQENTEKPKVKSVKKQKQRQKMQISDTKLLLNLMKKK